MKSQQWLFDSARKRTHLRPRLCGERPYEEEQYAGRNFIPDQTTAVETTFWRAWILPNSCCGNAIMFSPQRWGWLGLLPTYWGWKKRVRKKNRPSWVWNGMLSLKLSIFSRLWSCFPHGFVYVSSQCGCHVSLELKVGTRRWSQRSRHRHHRSTKNDKGDHRPIVQKKKKKKARNSLYDECIITLGFSLPEKTYLKKKKLKVGRPKPPQPPRVRRPLYSCVQCGEMKVQHRRNHVRTSVRRSPADLLSRSLRWWRAPSLQLINPNVRRREAGIHASS